VDVTKDYITTIDVKSPFAQFTPYELYLKFLYEYFRGQLNLPDEIEDMYLPTGFKKLKYQEEAVLNARKVLDEYGGAFLSDVVGLGKTFMSALLAQQLNEPCLSSPRRICWTSTIPAHGRTCSANSAFAATCASRWASWIRCWAVTSRDTKTSSLTNRTASAPKTRKVTRCSRRFVAASVQEIDVPISYTKPKSRVGRGGDGQRRLVGLNGLVALAQSQVSNGHALQDKPFLTHGLS
jgi:hypothetical protein